MPHNLQIQIQETGGQLSLIGMRDSKSECGSELSSEAMHKTM